MLSSYSYERTKTKTRSQNKQHPRRHLPSPCRGYSQRWNLCIRGLKSGDEVQKIAKHLRGVAEIIAATYEAK